MSDVSNGDGGQCRTTRLITGLPRDGENRDRYQDNQQQERTEPAPGLPWATELDEVAPTGLPATRRCRCHAFIIVAAGRGG